MTPAERFATAYALKLAENMRKNPQHYFGLDCNASIDQQAMALSVRMTVALAKGTAILSPQGKAAARALGINPTQKAIRAFLTTPDLPGEMEASTV